MTPSEPQTEAGRRLAARAKREAWGNWEGIAQFEIPAIEREAQGIPLIPDHPYPLRREQRVPPDLSEDPEGEHCFDCGKAVGLVWTAPDSMWADVTGNDGGGLLCIRCFDDRATAQGRLIRWVPQSAYLPTGGPLLDVKLLREYGTHKSACYYAMDGSGESAMPCSCGWLDVLARLASESSPA